MISDNLQKVLSQIRECAANCSRDSSEIELVCASKYADADQIRQAFVAGAKIFGENKVQDAKVKIEQLQDLDINWHMLGHLQTNKAKEAVRLFSLIQSVDSLHLAEELDKFAGAVNKIQHVLIEVNTTGEKQKYGVNPERLSELLNKIAALRNIRVEGLMTMGKFTKNPEENRPYFKKLKNLAQRFNLKILSMGMTDDFKVAIAEGSNMVRIGRAIWGIE